MTRLFSSRYFLSLISFTICLTLLFLTAAAAPNTYPQQIPPRPTDWTRIVTPWPIQGRPPYPTPVPPAPGPAITFKIVRIGFYGEHPPGGCYATLHITVHGGQKLTGNVHVWNDAYGVQGDVYPTIAFIPGDSQYGVTLGGREPQFRRHKIWITAKTTSGTQLVSNTIDWVICRER